MQLVNAQTGKEEALDDDALIPALAAGTHTPAGARALINPDGELVFSPLENVKANLAQYGYSVPTQEQLTELANQKQYGEGAGNVVKAGLEGAARGATFGLSDVAEPYLTGTTPEAIAQRKERNPTSATIGEIGGAVGSALLAPELSPAGLLSKAGAGIAERLAPEALSEGATLAARALNAAGQIGARAAGSAVEGAAYGLGQTVSEAALGDPDLNAEKVMANIGYGGFFGGALGGLLKAGEIAIPTSVSKAQESVQNAYDRLVGKVGADGEFEAGPLTKGVAKAGEFMTGEPAEEILDHAKKLRTGDVLSDKEYQTYKRNFSSSMQETYDSLNKATLEASTKIRPQEIGAISADLDPALTASELQNVGNKMNIVISEIEANPDAYTPAVGKSLERMKQTLDKSLVDQVAPSGGELYDVPKTAADHYLALNDLKKRLYADQQSLKGGSFTDKKSMDLVSELYDAVQGSLKDPEVWGETAVRQDSYNTAISQHRAASEQFQQEFMTKKKIGGKLVWRINEDKLNTFLNNINDSRSIPQQEALKNFFESSRSAIDEIEKTYHSAAFERFDKDSLLNQLTKNEASATEAQSIIAGQPNMGYGGIRNALTAMVRGEGPQSLTGLFLKAASDPYATINRLSNLERAAQKSTATIMSATKSVFQPAAKGAYKIIGPVSGKLSEEMQQKQFDRQVKQIEQHNASPDVTADILEASTRDMYHVAPNLSASMQMAALRGSQFLSSKIPRPIGPQLPLDKPFKASRPQIIQFSRYYNIVHKPLAALNELKSGHVFPETVETLQNVYPSLYTEMKTELIGSLTSTLAKKEPVPYQKRIAISAFLGSPLDSSLIPQSIQSNQATLAMQNAKQAQEKASAVSSKGIGNLGLSGRLKTNIQDSADREGA